MRSACAAPPEPGYKLIAAGMSEQVLPASYDEILARTMMPVAHLTWAPGLSRHRRGGRGPRPRLRSQGSAPSGCDHATPGAAHLTRAGASCHAA